MQSLMQSLIQSLIPQRQEWLSEPSRPLTCRP